MVVRTPSRRFAAALAARADAGADATQIAEAVCAAWQHVRAALDSLIGKRGSAAFARRALQLAARRHPWLAAGVPAGEAAVEMQALKAVLAQQRSATTAAAGGSLVETLDDLLCSLVGQPLTERLLSSAWADAPGASSAESSR